MSYDVDMQEKLNDLEGKRSSVKITGFSSKRNMLAEQDDVLNKKNKTEITESDEVIPYKKSREQLLQMLLYKL